jgi:hypothetical protein
METKQMHRRDTFSVMKAVRNCCEDLFREQDVDIVAVSLLLYAVLKSTDRSGAGRHGTFSPIPINTHFKPCCQALRVTSLVRDSSVGNRAAKGGLHHLKFQVLVCLNNPERREALPAAISGSEKLIISSKRGRKFQTNRYQHTQAMGSSSNAQGSKYCMLARNAEEQKSPKVSGASRKSA